MHVPARLAALRASTLRTIVQVLTIISRAIRNSRVIRSAAPLINAAVRTVRNWVLSPVASTLRNRVAIPAVRFVTAHVSRVTQRVSLVASVSGALVAATAVAVIVALVTSSGNAGSDVSAAGLAAPAHPVAAKAAPPVHRATAGSHQAGAQPSAAPQRSSASHPAQHAAPHAAAKPAASHRAKPAHLAARHQAVPNTWRAITEAAAGHPHGGALTPAQKLLPAGLSRGQAALPITPARAENAQLITAQALHLHMGIRSAVIAVATAMQESTLENLSYGDRDSLGLFQQRPSAGWGSPRQITDPTYAADAFLHALASYQHADPAWASQPLWEAAQGVQRSAYPTAYAQWEDQAAHIVAVAARHLM